MIRFFWLFFCPYVFRLDEIADLKVISPIPIAKVASFIAKHV